MQIFKLTKTQNGGFRGARYTYRVEDAAGNIIATSSDNRNYVAAIVRKHQRPGTVPIETTFSVANFTGKPETLNCRTAIQNDTSVVGIALIETVKINEQYLPVTRLPFGDGTRHGEPVYWETLPAYWAGFFPGGFGRTAVTPETALTGPAADGIGERLSEIGSNFTDPPSQAESQTLRNVRADFALCMDGRTYEGRDGMVRFWTKNYSAATLRDLLTELDGRPLPEFVELATEAARVYADRLFYTLKKERDDAEPRAASEPLQTILQDDGPSFFATVDNIRSNDDAQCIEGEIKRDGRTVRVYQVPGMSRHCWEMDDPPADALATMLGGLSIDVLLAHAFAIALHDANEGRDRAADLYQVQNARRRVVMAIDEIARVAVETLGPGPAGGDLPGSPQRDFIETPAGGSPRLALMEKHPATEPVTNTDDISAQLEGNPTAEANKESWNAVLPKRQRRD